MRKYVIAGKTYKSTELILIPVPAWNGASTWEVRAISDLTKLLDVVVEKLPEVEVK